MVLFPLNGVWAIALTQNGMWQHPFVPCEFVKKYIMCSLCNLQLTPRSHSFFDLTLNQLELVIPTISLPAFPVHFKGV